MRVVLFLTVFSNKVSNELYKKCNIDLANLATTTNVFTSLRREELTIYVNEDF